MTCFEMEAKRNSEMEYWIALYCETLGEKKQLMLKIKICHFASLFRCDTFES